MAGPHSHTAISLDKLPARYETDGGPVLHYIAPRTSPTLASNHHTGARQEPAEGSEGKIMGKKEEARTRGSWSEWEGEAGMLGSHDMPEHVTAVAWFPGPGRHDSRPSPGRSYCKQLAQAKPAACSACSACNGRPLCSARMYGAVYVHSVVRADCFLGRKKNAARLKSPGSHGRTEAVKPWKKRC